MANRGGGSSSLGPRSPGCSTQWPVKNISAFLSYTIVRLGGWDSKVTPDPRPWLWGRPLVQSGPLINRPAARAGFPFTRSGAGSLCGDSFLAKQTEESILLPQGMCRVCSRQARPSSTLLARPRSRGGVRGRQGTFCLNSVICLH